MKTNAFGFGWLRTFTLLLALPGLSSALTITRTSDSILYIDTSSSVWCSYASYQVINNDGVTYSNLWVKLDSFSGTNLRLGGGDPGVFNLGTLANNQTNTVFFYLQATNTTATAETHTVRVYRGYPTSGTQLTNQSFSLTVVSANQNSSQTINTVSIAPNPPTVGGLFSIRVTGATGIIGGANKVNFTPAVYTNWAAAAYQLVSCYITVAGGNSGSYSNALFLALSAQTATYYTNIYWFRAVAVTASNSISPLSIQSSGGGNYTHAPPPSAGVIPAIQPATNQTVVTNFASAVLPYTNQLITFTVRFSNSSTNPISLDSILDTLPSNLAYLTNSSTFNGLAVANPSISGQSVTWSERYSVAPNSTSDFTFQVYGVSAGYGTNFVLAYSQSTPIDTTLVTTDAFPASTVVRVLLRPTPIDDALSTQEDTALTGTAPGLLANDLEPNGFALSVVSYTQPSNGSVTVGPDGSYSYTPAANFNGSDSFTYTMTNGYGGGGTAAVSVTISSVNDAPTLGALSDLSLSEDAGQQTVPLSGISAGSTNETSQTLTVTAISGNPSLIPNPTVTYTSPNSTGSLTFTPASGASGQAVITVIVQDSGGTSNGGINSVTNTFTVTVGAVSTVWGPGMLRTNRFWDATGLASTGFEQAQITGTLEIQATSNNPITLTLLTPPANGASNFTYSSSYTWTIATTTRGISGFDSNKFVLDDNSFSNDLAGGTFSLVLSGNSNSLQVLFNPNHPPVAAAASYGRAWGTALRIPITNLVSTFTSDPDGDRRALLRLGASTNGAFVSTNTTEILVASTNNFAESFQFVVQDLRSYRGGDTVLTATNWLTVTISNAVGQVQTLTPSGSGIQLHFAGVPGYSYEVERSTNLVLWESIATTNAPTQGVWDYFDPAPPQPQGFYRLKQH